MTKKKVITPVPATHSYRLVSQHSPTLACYADIDRIDKLPPAEYFPTLEAAIDRIPHLFGEVARLCFPQEMPLPPGAVTVTVTTAFGSRAVSNKTLVRVFKPCGSLPLVGLVNFWGTYYRSITCLLQGDKEIRKWADSKAGREIKDLMKSLGAKGATVNGLYATNP